MIALGILRYESRRLWVGWRWMLAWLFQGVVLLCFVLWMKAASIGHTRAIVLFAQMGIVLLAGPLFAGITREPTHMMTPGRSYGIVLAKWLGAILVPASFTAIGVSLLANPWSGSVFGEWIPLSKALTLLLGLLSFSLALGMGCMLLFRHVKHALFSAYLVLGLLVTDVFWFPSLVDDHLSRWIPFLLLLNPFVSLSAILHIDLFRTPYLYEVSRITSYGYVYPPWYDTLVAYALGTVGCLAFATWRLRVMESRR